MHMNWDIILKMLRDDLIDRLNLDDYGEKWVRDVFKNPYSPIRKYNLSSVLNQELYFKVIQSVCTHTANLIEESVNDKELQLYHYRVGKRAVTMLLNIDIQWEYYIFEDLKETKKEEFPLNYGNRLFHLYFPTDFTKACIKSVLINEPNYVYNTGSKSHLNT